METLFIGIIAIMALIAVSGVIRGVWIGIDPKRAAAWRSERETEKSRSIFKKFKSVDEELEYMGF